MTATTDMTYSFAAMTAADLPTIRRWLATPDVARWWRDVDTQLALISADLDDPAMAQWIVSCGGRPFAYLQCYDCPDGFESGVGTQPACTHGIDQFIGEPDMIGRGHGSAFIRAFTDRLLASGTQRVITDPDPDNTRAVRAYEKAGFRKDRVVDTPDGPALLMVRTP
ncbi:GNAT family N-acetyltransferase [Bradyrhizobium sp. U87765 SZCCT0110]|uniref:GNAT family N-acetyltransferase n=2 Tax=Bradyrhizobium TaxID=374 RepID=UPI0020127ECE|nr:GNAT family N-acetyltransferase [Bradyrhizobium sp. U87765 SZCCT0110]